MLSAEQILGAKDAKTETVHVPEWGGDVGIRSLTAAERDDFEQACLTEQGELDRTNIRAKLLVRALCDAEGRRLFLDEQATELAEKSGAVCSRLFETAQRLNGLRKQDVDELLGN